MLRIRCSLSFIIHLCSFVDGKQIDPKLIRVIPTVKRVINAVLKPPSPSHVKRIIGCSWSAFRGKVRMSIFKLAYRGYIRIINYMSDQRTVEKYRYTICFYLIYKQR